MEPIVADSITLHSHLSNFTDPSQRDFVKRRALHDHSASRGRELLNSVKGGPPPGQHGALRFFPSVRAFDRMNFELLIAKMSSLGIGLLGISFWTRAYLIGRTFSVQVGSSRSGSDSCTSNVFQGSRLDPLLFSLFAQDLSLALKDFPVSYECFAEDKIICKHILIPRR